MSSVRQKKVAAQVRRIVSEVFARELADPRVTGLITVTRVEITPDLREAKVYVSVLGQKGTAATVIHGLESATRRIQESVKAGLPTRTSPHLQFVLDDTMKREAEMFKLIDRVAREGRGGSAETLLETPPEKAADAPRKNKRRKMPVKDHDKDAPRGGKTKAL